MKKSAIVLQSFAFLILLSGCVSRIGLKEPLTFAPSSVSTIPIHLGVLFPDGMKHHSFKQRGMELLVGKAVKENIGNSLLSSFQSVTVSTDTAELPATINAVANVRFDSGTDFNLPLTIFQEIKLTVVLDFKIIDKNTKAILWKTTARGEKKGHQPPNLGLLNISFVNAFYRNLTRDSVTMALDDLNEQIQTKGKEILRLQSGAK
jgi:hypothetical protein